MVLASCAAPVGGGDPAPAPRPQPPSARPVAPAFPGDVSPGEVRWGAAIGSNSDPSRHENVTRQALGVRRTYFQWQQRSSGLPRIAAADLAAGRLPWVSIKPPDWSAMAAGRHDGEIDELLRGLDRLGGPVWLTVHHEPEGGGGVNRPDDPAGAAAWRGMQIRVRQRMDALGTTNIAFAPILMAWTFDPLSRRNPLDYWVEGIWDFAGIDYYVYDHAKEDVATAYRMWLLAREFFGRRGMDIAVGEWGNRGTDWNAGEEMRRFYDHAVGSADDGLGAQVIGLAYFDTDLHSPSGAWTLGGEPLRVFRELTDRPTSVVVGG